MNKELDPYRAAQAKQRKDANLARQATLRKQGEASLGDPVRSRPTPFIQSLQPNATIESLQTDSLNYYVQRSEMEESIERSRWLTEPVVSTNDPQKDDLLRQQHEIQHKNAVEAMERITALSMGNSKDRTRLNIQRCINEFGRHNTDQFLPPKPVSSQTPPRDPNEILGRSGPDTGSSEVQAAILTAKINVLVNNMSNGDKHNKRNLRLLVHKRQKHLNYLRRKERGGPRWQNLVEKLGINEAMYKGEISLP